MPAYLRDISDGGLVKHLFPDSRIWQAVWTVVITSLHHAPAHTNTEAHIVTRNRTKKQNHFYKKQGLEIECVTTLML